MQAVQLRGITKRFGNVLANDHVNFELQEGEIHALLGENGAGKTTLMRILYGLYHADEGQILVKDELVQIVSPKDAIRNGIGMVTQHFTLVMPLTVTENMALSDKGGIRLDLKLAQQQVKQAAEQYGIQVDPAAIIRNLSVGERQRVEILKALYRKARVLILDEPTAVLVPQEVDALFESLQQLRRAGLSVIFISHKLNEVMNMCDRVTVLRAGKLIGTVNKSDTSPSELASMMVGRETFGVMKRSSGLTGKNVLCVENLSALDKKGLPALREISFSVNEGEVLGIAGVSGNGQTELGQVLEGTLKPTAGKVLLGEKDISHSTPEQISHLGVGRIPEDRHAGVVGELSVAENLALENLEDFITNGMLDRKKILKNAQDLIAEYQIKATPADNARKLSGGNLQKVILARALARKPALVIAAQPTRGLDVGATDYVRTKLLEQCVDGAAVLLLSEDLEEIFALSDRIAVIYEGQIMGIVQRKDATMELLGLMMSGAKRLTTQSEEVSRV
ncbi:MAG TPA: ABC transporter ATP-binding protein [Anaerolineaceae bacterium]|nr:ABC transporter ATP-binding protein [Anaerolineaceae bacterium]